MLVNTDCRHYRGDAPCAPHKREGYHCEDCPDHDPCDTRILIVKLGALGDVIRTTPILHRLREEHPRCQITWVTDFPEAVPSVVDVTHRMSWRSAMALAADEFDLVLSLDKDIEAIALAKLVRASDKRGFTVEAGRCAPLDENARHKWLTGIFDDVSRANTKSYPAEIFEICGYEFGGEKYILDRPDPVDWDLPEGGPLVGLNTGCGSRWPTRLWPEEHWADLCRRLTVAGCTVILLGGKQEDARNRHLSKETGAAYLGHHPFGGFVSLVDKCDLVVTGVTMAMHVAIGLGKKIVLFNSVFNRREFELYGLGTVLEPPGLDCLGCYRQDCDRPCMERITPEAVADAVLGLLGGAGQ